MTDIVKDRVFLSKLDLHRDKKVGIRGWVNKVRSSGKISFLELRDGTDFVQCIIEHKNVDEKVVECVKALSQESTVLIEGVVAEHFKKKGVFEIHVSHVELLAPAVDYPISPKEHGDAFLLDRRHLWLRSKKQWAIQRIRNTVINALYEYLNAENFIKIDSPIITSTSCEGTTTLFGFEYFDMGKGYLSQSGQLYLEAAAAAHNRVFDFGPVFRAEKSKTRKHLTEFWMLDVEMAFCEYSEIMDTQEALIKHVFKKVLAQNPKELEALERDSAALLKVIERPFERITHSQAVELLQKKGSDINYDMDLGAGDETLLSEIFDIPVFIERWPAHIKAFYMKKDPKDARFVIGSDLMANDAFGEIIGGSQREDDYDLLLESVKKENIPMEDFEWYLDLRKYGSFPHGGFGIGLERLVLWVCGTKHIRETIPFPRMIHRFKP